MICLRLRLSLWSFIGFPYVLQCSDDLILQKHNKKTRTTTVTRERERKNYDLSTFAAKVNAIDKSRARRNMCEMNVGELHVAIYLNPDFNRSQSSSSPFYKINVCYGNCCSCLLGAPRLSTEGYCELTSE